MLAYIVSGLIVLAGCRHRFGAAGDVRILFFTTTAQAQLAVGLLLQSNRLFVAWAALALVLTAIASKVKSITDSYAVALHQTAVLTTTIATFGWLFTVLLSTTNTLFVADATLRPLVNHSFLTAGLVTLGWLFILRKGQGVRGVAFAAAQIVIHLAIAYELSRLAVSFGEVRLAALCSTILFTISAGGQFIKSVRMSGEACSRGFAVASYILFALAASKLLIWDLSSVNNVVRAGAAVGVGCMFMLAAFLADKLGGRAKSGS